MKQIPLGSGAEFDLIRRILKARAHGVAPPDSVRVGPGDDCAVVSGDGIALSVDMSVEGVHFRRDWLELDEIGYRSTAAALSDLAAVAATPIGVLVALALQPRDVDKAVRIMAGASQAAADVNAVLLGGDVTRTEGPLVIDVVVVGNAQRPVLRAGAKPGDALWVTGELGGAAAAVRALLAGQTPDASARRVFARPVPRIAEAVWLAQRDVVHAMIDISDGLAGDLGHVAAASGVSITVNAVDIPLHAALRAQSTDREQALQLALTGGEDYELCFAAVEGKVELLVQEFADTFAVRLTRIGTVEEGADVRLRGFNGDVAALHLRGYDHFAGNDA